MMTVLVDGWQVNELTLTSVLIRKLYDPRHTKCPMHIAHHAHQMPHELTQYDGIDSKAVCPAAHQMPARVLGRGLLVSAAAVS